MQMEESGANLARSTADGAAEYYYHSYQQTSIMMIMISNIIIVIFIVMLCVSPLVVKDAQRMVVLSCAPVLWPEKVSSHQTAHQSAGLQGLMPQQFEPSTSAAWLRSSP